MNPEIGGIATGAIISGLIELFKYAGLPSRYAPWANIALAGVFGALAMAVNIYPDAESYVAAGLQVVITILTAAGFYDMVVQPGYLKRLIPA